MGFSVWGLRFMVKGEELRVQDLGFRVSDSYSGLRVSDLGFRFRV